MTLRESLDKAIYRQISRGSPATLLALDIDHFKKINDLHGHEVGDNVLIQLAAVIRSDLREDDYAFRTGGEEFLVILNDINEKVANTIAERLRHRIESTDFIGCDPVTISIGVAQYSASDSWTHWVKRADNSLYVAKQLGRNRVAMCTKPVLVQSDTQTTPPIAKHLNRNNR